MLVSDLFRTSFPQGASRWTRTGIDVSGNQPAHVIGDLWRAGRRFDHVVVKATEGTSFRSDEARQQAADTLDLGLGLAFYHWASYRTSAEAEARNAIAYIRSVGVPAPSAVSPVGVWVDAEDPTYSRHVGRYTEYTLEIVDRIGQALGVRVGIYTAGWWANGRLDDRCAPVPLWVADYDDQRTWRNTPEPVMPQAWSGQRAHGWQWTSLGPLGHLDLNVWDPSLYPTLDPQHAGPGAPDPTPLLPYQPDRPGGPMVLLIRDPDTGTLYWWDGQTRTPAAPREGDFATFAEVELALKRLIDAHPSATRWDDGALYHDVPAHDLALIPVR